MSIYACDMEDCTWGYRERITAASVPVTCCETGITIPAGMPFAECHAAICDCGDCVFCETMDFGDANTDQIKVYRQCIEVWRYLRNRNHKHGACAAFGEAVAQYRDEWASSGLERDKLAWLGLDQVIQKTRIRYASGRTARLHAHELASLQGGELVPCVPFSVRSEVQA